MDLMLICCRPKPCRNILRLAVDMDIHGYIHGYIHVWISDLDHAVDIYIPTEICARFSFLETDAIEFKL